MSEEEPRKKTPSEMLMELLEDEDVDKMTNMAIVYEDHNGICVKGGHRGKFEVIGILEYGIKILFEATHEKPGGIIE